MVINKKKDIMVVFPFEFRFYTILLSVSLKYIDVGILIYVLKYIKKIFKVPTSMYSEDTTDDAKEPVEIW